MVNLIVKDVDDASMTEQNELKGYLLSHEWSFVEE